MKQPAELHSLLLKRKTMKPYTILVKKKMFQ